MRTYISIPYLDNDDDELLRRCRAAHKKYDAPDNFVITPKDACPDSSTPYDITMGKRIEAELSCDKVIFADGWALSRDCCLEMGACEIYKIPYKVDVHL